MFVFACFFSVVRQLFGDHAVLWWKGSLTFHQQKAESQIFQTYAHTQRLTANNCWVSGPPWVHPPQSPGWEHWSRGQHDKGESLAKWPVLLRRPVVERVYRKGKCSVGSLRYQWKCILCATAGGRGAFLYLPLLIPSTKERQCQRNKHQECFQERMAKPITIQSSRKMFQTR